MLIIVCDKCGKEKGRNSCANCMGKATNPKYKSFGQYWEAKNKK